MRAAAIQLNSTADVGRNLEIAERLVRAAAADGAELLALPEKWNALGTGDELRAAAEPLDGPTLTAAAGWARELGVNLLAGSIVEQLTGTDKLANTSVLLDREGGRVAVYRKIHMFDVEVAGVSYRESEHERGGQEVVSGRVDGVEVGLSVCYDLRFPELYRELAVAGATVLAVPSAFTVPTGRDHWQVLLRARAIENQAFVLAPDQYGPAPPNHDSYGHSMIVDPWGTVLATAPDTDGHVCAELDLGALEAIRERLPALAHRRPEAYRRRAATSAAAVGTSGGAG